MHLDRRQLLAASAAGFASLSWGASSSLARDLPTDSPKSLGFDAERLKRINVALQARVDNAEAPGYVTAIMRNGKILHFDTVGYRNIEAKTPMSRDTIFRIRSMTKPITSVAAMMLVEENKLRLTDPISKYIPAFAKQQVYVSGEGDAAVFAPARRQVQVRNLLMHTAGYSYGEINHPAAKAYRTGLPRDAQSLAELCQAAAQLPLQFEPGTQWQYGISTDILGHVVELASGQSLPKFFQERIFTPLGMTETAFSVAADNVSRFANLYTRKDGKLALLDDAKTSGFLNPPLTPSGGGGLTSTADDYLRFATMLINEGELDGARLLSPQTIRLMSTNLLSDAMTSARDSGFGLGFGIDLRTGMRGQYAGAGTFHWSGADRTHFWVDPTNKIVGLSMTQVSPFNSFFEEDMRALTYQAFMG